MVEFSNLNQLSVLRKLDKFIRETGMMGAGGISDVLKAKHTTIWGQNKWTLRSQ